MQDKPPRQNSAASPAIRPAGLIIRARGPADAEGIAQLHNLPGYRYGTLRMPHHSVEEIRKGIETQAANTTALIAIVDGVIVGDIGLTRHANRRAHAASVGMGVHDDHTGRGIGRSLMAEALEIADNWLEIRRVELTVYTDNAAALRLYESFGFEREGHLRDFAFRAGQRVDAYAMARLRS